MAILSGSIPYENEVWKDIVGYEGLYQISNLGRVKSLKRYVNHPLVLPNLSYLNH